MATDDPVGVALASLGAGATAGGAVMSGGSLALRLAQTTPGGANADAQFFILSAGLLGAVVTAAVTAVWYARTIDELWRRGVAATIAVFAAVMLGAAAAFADAAAGVAGLGVYVAVLVAAHLYIRHRARAPSP